MYRSETLKINKCRSRNVDFGSDDLGMIGDGRDSRLNFERKDIII